MISGGTRGGGGGGERKKKADNFKSRTVKMCTVMLKVFTHTSKPSESDALIITMVTGV